MKIASMLILTVCLALPFSAITRDAQAAPNNSKTANSAGQSLKVNSRAQAIQLAQRQYQGKVLKAQSSSVNSHPGYQIKMLSKEGLVFYVSVDAQTGRISRN